MTPLPRYASDAFRDPQHQSAIEQGAEGFRSLGGDFALERLERDQI